MNSWRCSSTLTSCHKCWASLRAADMNWCMNRISRCWKSAAGWWLPRKHSSSGTPSTRKEVFGKMTSPTYQRDSKTYRFSLPKEIGGNWIFHPLAFSILVHFCYLNSHHKDDAVPSVDRIAALLRVGVTSCIFNFPPNGPQKLPRPLMAVWQLIGSPQCKPLWN